VIQFILRRMAWAVVLLFAITMVCYSLFFLVPSTPGTTGRGTERESINLRESVEIDGPIYKEYGLFLWRIGHGSFGESWVSEDDVNEVLLKAMPVTLSLVFGGLVMWMLLAVPIGILSALRPRSVGDRLATIFVLIGVSAHPVWLGLVLSYFLGYKAHLFPVGGGYCDLKDPTYYCGGLTQWAWHLFLPWLTFALLYAALYARMIRASVIETMDEDYVRTARAKGASERRVLKAHVLRNAMLPVVTMLGMDAGYWMGNALFVETVFGLPGVGRLLTSSLARRDLPVLMAITVFVALLIIMLNLIVDLVYGVLDPRTRIAGDRREGRTPGTAQARTAVSSAEQPAGAR
jgi:peptide/nickel transport system permease protein